MQAPLYRILNPEQTVQRVRDVQVVQLTEQSVQVVLPWGNMLVGQVVWQLEPNRKYPDTQLVQ